MLLKSKQESDRLNASAVANALEVKQVEAQELRLGLKAGKEMLKSTSNPYGRHMEIFEKP